MVVLGIFTVFGYYLEIRFDLRTIPTAYFYLFSFIYYLITYFVVSFFSAVMATCVSIRMKGDNPTLNDGIKNASAHVGALFLWSILSATVGLVLRIIFERSALLGKIVVWIVGALWSLATFFIIPVLVLENLSVGKGIKRSKEIFENMGRKFRRRTWRRYILWLCFCRFGCGVCTHAFASLAQPTILIAPFVFYFILVISSAPGILILSIAASTGKILRYQPNWSKPLSRKASFSKKYLLEYRDEFR